MYQPQEPLRSNDHSTNLLLANPILPLPRPLLPLPCRRRISFHQWNRNTRRERRERILPGGELCGKGCIGQGCGTYIPSHALHDFFCRPDPEMKSTDRRPSPIQSLSCGDGYYASRYACISSFPLRLTCPPITLDERSCSNPFFQNWYGHSN